MVAGKTISSDVTVTTSMIENAPQSSSNWLVNGRDYGNTRFSPLKGINTSNVKNLTPVALVGGVLLALPGLTTGRFFVAMVAFGSGTAFTMGAPLNRIALALHSDEQAGEALAAVAARYG